jgi:septum formation protein
LEKVNVLALAKAGAVYKQVCNINNAGTSVSAGESAESVAGSRSASMGNTGASAGDATPAGGAAGAVYEQVCKELGERNLFIVGCDSLFDVDGKSIGKPYTKENAMRCLKKMSGKTGTLYTGHAVINCKTGERVSSVCASEITLDHLPDEFIDAYTDTSEPLESAGSFTLEGLGAAYISSINGSYTNILGLSIPTLRELLEHFNIQWTSLWHDSQTEIDKRNI